MKTFKLMLWLALALPFLWWQVAIWKLYFAKRVLFLGELK
jgi:hypothetical protein